MSIPLASWESGCRAPGARIVSCPLRKISVTLCVGGGKSGNCVRLSIFSMAFGDPLFGTNVWKAERVFFYLIACRVFLHHLHRRVGRYRLGCHSGQPFHRGELERSGASLGGTVGLAPHSGSAEGYRKEEADAGSHEQQRGSCIRKFRGRATAGFDLFAPSYEGVRNQLAVHLGGHAHHRRPQYRGRRTVSI